MAAHREGGAGSIGRQQRAWGLRATVVACGLAAGALDHSENLRAVRQTVNQKRNRDSKVMLAMLELNGTQSGTVFAGSLRLTLVCSGALPVMERVLVVEKRRLCGDLSPASALAILQKDPPTMALTLGPPLVTASIYSPLPERTSWNATTWRLRTTSPVTSGCR